ncbi:hypothetical protein [Mesobacillus zeae]|uniref:hypothetical protein n=1 Tax=Mesobacillus zeae TaxID=1917180 RepID=UPI0015E6537C|nr:hypothetical protein [Mesobacillus zeae]
MKKDWLSTLYIVILAIFAFYTGEIVTFIMLGVILIVLTNINRTLKQLLAAVKAKNG